MKLSLKEVFAVSLLTLAVFSPLLGFAMAQTTDNLSLAGSYMIAGMLGAFLAIPALLIVE